MGQVLHGCATTTHAAVGFCMIARRRNGALAERTESSVIARMLGRQHRVIFGAAMLRLEKTVMDPMSLTTSAD